MHTEGSKIFFTSPEDEQIIFDLIKNKSDVMRILAPYPYEVISQTSIKILPQSIFKDKVFIGKSFIDDEGKRNEVIGYHLSIQKYLVEKEGHFFLQLMEEEDIKKYIKI